MDTPKHAVTTPGGPAGSGGAIHAAARTMPPPAVAGGPEFIMGLMFGMAEGEEIGYPKGRA